ncbi:unnamed protein product [Ilex paraguariensis]|uniref:Uncharacterized protein n=1 Tax=Ilex paraguariensis TaxID=185542 RepID=A0ABC8ULF1_9AQUA
MVIISSSPPLSSLNKATRGSDEPDLDRQEQQGGSNEIDPECYGRRLLCMQDPAQYKKREQISPLVNSSEPVE